MANMGMNIRIPKQSLIKLSQLQGKQLIVKFNGGRQLAGLLKSWDKSLNLILDNAQQMMGVEEGMQNWRNLGLAIVKGSQIQSISLRDGYEIIDNPYAEADEQ